MAEDKKASLVLLGFWVSPFGQRVRIALAEKGVEYEYKEEDRLYKEDLFDKSPLLLASNPVYKKVPVLIHDGKPVCGSLNILRYIDEVWSDNSPLLPADPYARAQAHFWGDYVDNKVFECASRLWKLEGEARKQATKDMLEILKQLEEVLGDKVYFGGETFGFVDIALVPFTTWFHSLETFGGFNTEEEFPKLVAWANRCMKRKTVAENLQSPDKVYEFILYLKKKYARAQAKETQRIVLCFIMVVFACTVLASLY